MKNLIILICGLVIGFLLSVGIYVSYSLRQIGEPPKAKIELTKKTIKEDQAKLGITCKAAPKLVSKYVESLTPLVENLKKKERINPSDPVLPEGKRVVDIFFTCHFINMMAESSKLELPSPPIFDDEELRDRIATIHLLINQSAAEWCEAKCLADSLDKVTTHLERAKDRLALHNA